MRSRSTVARYLARDRGPSERVGPAAHRDRRPGDPPAARALAAPAGPAAGADARLARLRGRLRARAGDAAADDRLRAGRLAGCAVRLDRREAAPWSDCDGDL